MASELKVDKFTGITTAGEITIPTIQGRTLEYIPFVVINTTSLGCDYEDSPLLDLVNMNINHYKGIQILHLPLSLKIQRLKFRSSGIIISGQGS